MSQLPPIDPFAPLTATYTQTELRGYVRFARKADEPIRRALMATFDYYYAPERMVWAGDPDALPEVVAFLESAGVKCSHANVVDGMRRREVRAAEEREAAEQAANAATLSSFDWSGFPAWAEANLVIKDKRTSAPIPFRLNKLQRRLFDAMLDQWRRKGWIRVNIVKSRQIGFSTFIQGFCFYIALHVPCVDALVTAHRDDAARDVFDRTKFFYERCPVKKDIHLNNLHEIKWKEPHRSHLIVSVADGVGRAGTRHLYHGSECAHYTTKGVDSMGNVESSVPKAPGTMVWYETTANGKNHFYDSWLGAGAAGYENFFVGFLEDDTCRLYDVALDDPRWANVPVEWTEDEPRLRRLARDFGLDERDIVAALCFRRQTIASKECRGLPTIFLREYPAVVGDAFSATGCHRFPLSIVEREWEKTTAAEERSPAPRLKVNSTSEWLPDPWGPLRIWKHPEPGASYVISGDFGRGRNVAGEGGDPSKLDYTTFGVWNEHTREEVAVWHGRMDPDKAAAEMVALGRYYNTAMLVPETNHYGMITVAMIRNHLKYARLYLREKIEKPTVHPVQQSTETAHWLDYGWWTGTDKSVGKENMMAWTNEAIRDFTIRVHEPEAWDECRTYMVLPDGSMAAENGKHDDRVMRMAIAISYMKLHPARRASETKPAEPIVAVNDAGEFRVNYGLLMQQTMATRRQQARRRDDCT